MADPNFVGHRIWTHEKRGGDVIVAAVREFKGACFLDVRLWANGGTTATGKGATIPIDLLASFVASLANYAETMRCDATDKRS